MKAKFNDYFKDLRQKFIAFISNNWQLKLISVLLSIFFWFVICEYVDPDTSVPVSNIKISVDYEGSVPQKANLGIMTVVDETVDVRVSGSRDTVALMDPKKITATLDLSNVTQKGEYDLPVIVDLGGQNLTKEEQSVDTIRVQFDTNRVANVKVNVKVSGEVPAGLMLEEPVLLNNFIVVTGPTTIVDTIVSAEVEIHQDEFSSTNTFKCDYVFVDKDGKVVDKTFLSMDAETLDITIPVVKEKTVPLSVSIINSSGGSDSTFCISDVTPKNIKITGSVETLNSINAIDLGVIDMAEKTEGFTTSMNVVLPNGVKNVENIETAKVTITFNDIQTKTIRVKNLKLENVPDGAKVRISESAINVRVRGIAEDIGKLNEGNVSVVVDYSQIEKVEGTNRLNAIVVFPDNLKVGAIGKYQLTVVS